MNPLLTLAVESDDVAKIAVVALGCIAFGIYSVASARAKAVADREREQTRREVAAYVAEGSMSVDDAERILAGKRSKKCTGNCTCAKKA